MRGTSGKAVARSSRIIIKIFAQRYYTITWASDREAVHFGQVRGQFRRCATFSSRHSHVKSYVGGPTTGSRTASAARWAGLSVSAFGFVGAADGFQGVALAGSGLSPKHGEAFRAGQVRQGLRLLRLQGEGGCRLVNAGFAEGRGCGRRPISAPNARASFPKPKPRAPCSA